MKNETKHTPEPWHIGAGNGEGSIFAESGRIRLEQGGTTLYPVANIGMGWSAAEDIANAHLISAAPELLAALQAIVTGNVYGNPTQWNLCLDRGIAAITKATRGAA